MVDFDRGTATGTTIGIGSVEYILDQINLTSINNDFSPSVDGLYWLGANTTAWSDVFVTSQYPVAQNESSGDGPAGLADEV